MEDKKFEAIMETLKDAIDEGIHVVDRNGISIMYSENMAVLEEVKVEDVLGKQFREVFSHIPEGESTVLRALNTGKKGPPMQQTFRNVYGKEITTMNTTLPISIDGEMVAVMEIAKDITDIKNMSDTLMELQEKYIGPAKLSQPKIRHYNFYDLVGENQGFKKSIDIAKKASQNHVPVFIYGETGTGKELFAQSVHHDGKRKRGPFLAQNCAAIPESLLEGILFGTSKGGFTGAIDRAGLFEQAQGGTLLLDEISAMPYELQSKLLRVLQEDYIRRLGGNRDIPVDVRIIATVNEDPEMLIESGALRKDLYYRLSVINLKIPPLRERIDDIPMLVERFVEKQSRKMEKKVAGITDDAIKKLQNYNYPGNIRELENIIMSAVAMVNEKERIEREHLLMNTSLGQEQMGGLYDWEAEPLHKYMERVEANIIKTAMESSGNNITVASAKLGMKRQTLQHKLKKL